MISNYDFILFSTMILQKYMKFSELQTADIKIHVTETLAPAPLPRRLLWQPPLFANQRFASKAGIGADRLGGWGVIPNTTNILNFSYLTKTEQAAALPIPSVRR